MNSISSINEIILVSIMIISVGLKYLISKNSNDDINTSSILVFFVWTYFVSSIVIIFLAAFQILPSDAIDFTKDGDTFLMLYFIIVGIVFIVDRIEIWHGEHPWIAIIRDATIGIFYFIVVVVLWSFIRSLFNRDE